MARRKFTDLEMGELLRQGKNVNEIAAQFSVTVQAIYKRMKRYNLNASTDIAFNQAAVVNQHHLNWSAQLLKINNSAQVWLDKLEELLASKHQEQIGSIVADLNLLLSEISEESKEVIFMPVIERLQSLKIYDLLVLDRLLKVQAEIRAQLKLVADVWKEKYDFEQLEMVQREILDEIGEASPETRRRIVDRLRAKMAVMYPGWNLSPVKI